MTRYAQDSDKKWLKTEYRQKHTLESLIYELSGPLNENDIIGKLFLIYVFFNNNIIIFLRSRYSSFF